MFKNHKIDLKGLLCVKKEIGFSDAIGQTVALTVLEIDQQSSGPRCLLGNLDFHLTLSSLDLLF